LAGGDVFLSTAKWCSFRITRSVVTAAILAGRRLAAGHNEKRTGAIERPNKAKRAGASSPVATGSAFARVMPAIRPPLSVARAITGDYGQDFVSATGQVATTSSHERVAARFRGTAILIAVGRCDAYGCAIAGGTPSWAPTSPVDGLFWISGEIRPVDATHISRPLIDS